MKRVSLAIVLSLVFVSCLIMMLPKPAEAIPAFARQNKISCTTCHAPFPRLKPFGEEFAGAGFRMPEGQEPTRTTYDVGDPLLHLLRRFPLAVRLEGFAEWKQDARAKTDAEFPWVFKILSGAPISKKFAYYFYFIVEQNEVEGLEDAYIQVNSPFGIPVDLMFGQFQVSDPLFKREVRLSRLDYEIYRVDVGDSRVTLTYDQGLMGSWTAPGDIDLVFQIVNGNGIHDPVADFDRDSNKNLGLRLARQFGPVRVGLFGYGGKEEGSLTGENQTIYFGPDFMIDISEKVQVNLQYLERRDEDPFFVGATSDTVTRGGFGEIVFLPMGPNGRWVLSGLYNKVESDDPLAERESLSVAAGYLAARNIRAHLEVGKDFEQDAERASIGIIAAF